MKNYCTACGFGTAYVNLKAPTNCGRCKRSFANLSGPTVKVNYKPEAKTKETFNADNVDKWLAKLPPIAEAEILKESNETINLTEIFSSEEKPQAEIVQPEEPVKKKRGRKPKQKTVKLKKGKNEKEVIANFFEVSESDLKNQE